MTYKRIGIILAAVLCIAMSHSTAFGGGWGPYFSWGRDQPSAGIPGFVIDRAVEEARTIGLPESTIHVAKRAAQKATVDLKFDHLTFGVLYDSAPSQDALFNYRATLGFDLATGVQFDTASISIPGFPTIDIQGLGIDVDKNGYGFTTTHTFGFGIVRSEAIKWWLGPGLRLNFDYYKLNGPYEAANLSIGGGPETGVNIHLSPDMSLCVGGGFHWNAFAYAAGSNNIGSFVWGDGPFYFVQAAVLFHTGKDADAWKTAPPPPPSPLTPLPNQ
jgi:hypothetical protein